MMEEGCEPATSIDGVAVRIQKGGEQIIDQGPFDLAEGRELMFIQGDQMDDSERKLMALINSVGGDLLKFQMTR